jgi:hypothetical protein
MLFPRYYGVDQIMDDEVCGACDTYRAHEKCIQSFEEENLKGTERLEELGADWKILF